MPRRLYPPALVVALLCTLLMAWLPNPPEIPGNPGEKFQHMAAFVALSVLAAGAFPEMRLRLVGERLSFLAAILEAVENIPALHRHHDAIDWLADTFAVIVTLVLVAVVRDQRKRRAPPTQSR